MKDVLPEYQSLLWDFARSPQRLSKDALAEVLDRTDVLEHERHGVVHRLIYYGFIGLGLEEEDQYIYDFHYQTELPLANIMRLANAAVFVSIQHLEARCRCNRKALDHTPICTQSPSSFRKS
jgi:hypothetical protein